MTPFKHVCCIHPGSQVWSGDLKSVDQRGRCCHCGGIVERFGRQVRSEHGEFAPLEEQTRIEWGAWE